MIQVVLHGKLEKFGPKLQFEVNRPTEVIRAIGYQIPEFIEELKDGSFAILKEGRPIGEDELEVTFGKSKRLDIVPVLEGEGGRGFGKIVLGIALVAAAFIAAPAAGGFAAAEGIAGGLGGIEAVSGLALGETLFSVGGLSVSAAQLAAIGGVIGITGAARLLSPTPEVGNIGERESPSEVPSALITSQVNTQEQGQSVPLGYGLVEVGGVTVEGSLTTEQTPIDQIIDDQTEFDSIHNFYAPLKNDFSSDTIEFVGFTSSIGIRNESLFTDWPVSNGTFFGHGAIDPALFRNTPVHTIGEIHDTNTDTYSIYVAMRLDTPQNYFEGITISNFAETVDYFTATIATSTYAEVNRKRYVRSRITNNLQESVIKVASWTWDRPGASDFAIVASPDDTTPRKFKLSYNVN